MRKEEKVTSLTPVAVTLVTVLMVAALAFPIPAAAQGPDEQAAAAPETREEEEEELTDRPNTGYVESAIVANRFFVRLDSARDGDRPDRAELFYPKCGCFRNPALEDVLGAAFDPTAPGPGAVPENQLDYEELELTVEWAFAGKGVSLFAELPFRAIDLGANDFSASGLGDLRVGTKIALQRTRDRHLTFQLRLYLPTGEPRDGLGTDHTSFEPGLLFYQRLANRWSVGAELKYWYPTDGSSAVGLSDDPADEFSGEILRYGFGVARDVTTSTGGLTFSPVVEAVGWSVLDGYKTPFGAESPSADGDTIVNLKIGARLRGSWPGSVYVGYGFALTGDVWYDDIVRIEYRRGF